MLIKHWTLNYYKDNTSQYSRRWAWGALLLYLLMLIAALLFLSIELPAAPPKEPILVELAPLPEPERPEPHHYEAQHHREVAAEEQTEPVRGTDQETRTVNPRALFKQSQGGVDAPENAGNTQAEEASEDRASGNGAGLSPSGHDQLDKGLQGRGLVGDLPRPRYTSDAEGRVVIRVAVDRTGRVTAATYEPKGSTTSNPTLIREAREAAMQARFTESRSFVQGGTITYIFTLKR